MLDLFKSKWSLVCCSKIVTIQSLISTRLGHKPLSTNFVVIFDNSESVITVELSYDVIQDSEYLLSLYTSVVLTEEYHVTINPLNPELSPICYLLAILGAHYFLHVSRIRVKSLTFRLLMSYMYIYIYIYIYMTLVA